MGQQGGVFKGLGMVGQAAAKGIEVSRDVFVVLVVLLVVFKVVFMGVVVA